MASVVWGRAFDGAGPAEVNGFGGLGSLIVCLREIGRVYYADHSRKVVVVLRPTANTLSGEVGTRPRLHHVFLRGGQKKVSSNHDETILNFCHPFKLIARALPQLPISN